MDRDQVNLIHYLYQGDPGRRIDEALVYGDGSTPPLCWCGPDTMVPLFNNQFVSIEAGEISANGPVMGFVDAVEQQLRRLPGPDFMFGYPISAPIRHEADRRPAFLAIPYRDRFDGVKAAVLDTADTCGFDCEVTGDLANPGTIIDQVWQGIRGADVVVADITGAKANVMIEVGMAAALGKEVIVISQDEALPFDIRHWRSLSYDPHKLEDLRSELEAAFDAVSARYPFEGPEPRF